MAKMFPSTELDLMAAPAAPEVDDEAAALAPEALAEVVTVAMDPEADMEPDMEPDMDMPVVRAEEAPEETAPVF